MQTICFWQIFGMFFGGRYIILLMGLFSMYAGFVYNDAFSKSFNIFGSSWNVSNMSNFTKELLDEEGEYQLDPKEAFTGPYPYGLDPVWQLSSNKLSFLNSFKMKMSVIFGIAQMTFGVVLGAFNHRYFKKPINMWCEFVPQMIFLEFIFGYLVVMIFLKWFLFNADNSKDAPSLIITLINMFLFTAPQSDLYSGQYATQALLVILAVVCIPWMLLAKPLLLKLQHNKNISKVSGALLFHDECVLGSFTCTNHNTRDMRLSVPSEGQCNYGGGLLLYETSAIYTRPKPTHTDNTRT